MPQSKARAKKAGKTPARRIAQTYRLSPKCVEGIAKAAKKEGKIPRAFIRELLEAKFAPPDFKL
jgi:hypothetical protein